MTFETWLADIQRSRKTEGTWRETRECKSDDFCSNDYLGLSQHSGLKKAVADATLEYGIGPRGSALVCGYSAHHEKLERALSDLKHTEATLLTPTGYAANISVLESLTGDDLHIFSDELNHASIVDGCGLAKRRGATLSIYRHADVEDLEEKLRRSTGTRKLVVTDSVFSMDGDIAPLQSIAEIAKRYDALTMVDEAHATLVFGDNGGGVAEASRADIDIHVGTLSKAFGLLGGFVSTRKEIRDVIVNRGRAFIYSTALPIPIVVGAMAAIEISKNEKLRDALWSNVDHFRNASGWQSRSPIFSIEVGDVDAAIALSRKLEAEGFWIPPIRPPTVPVGRSRLRVTIRATHDRDQLVQLAGLIRK